MSCCPHLCQTKGHATHTQMAADECVQKTGSSPESNTKPLIHPRRGVVQVMTPGSKPQFQEIADRHQNTDSQNPVPECQTPTIQGRSVLLAQRLDPRRWDLARQQTIQAVSRSHTGAQQEGDRQVGDFASEALRGTADDTRR